MLLRKFSGKMCCAAAALAFAAAGSAACGKDDSGNGSAHQGEKAATQGHARAQESAPPQDSEKEAKVTYEVTSTADKPFKVMFIEKTSSASVSDLVRDAAAATGNSTWTEEVTLSKGTDYAMIVVTPDITDFDSSAKFSCKITSGGNTVDEKKDQRGVVGCAGLKLQDQVKKEGS